MKTLIILFIFGALMLPLSPLMAAVNCECGSHATGITTYTVNGPGCCTSSIAAGSVGHQYSYEQNEGGWSLTGTTQISGERAQGICCPTP